MSHGGLRSASTYFKRNYPCKLPVPFCNSDNRGDNHQAFIAPFMTCLWLVLLLFAFKSYGEEGEYTPNMPHRRVQSTQHPYPPSATGSNRSNPISNRSRSRYGRPGPGHADAAPDGTFTRFEGYETICEAPSPYSRPL
jgi:hypothetical protein